MWLGLMRCDSMHCAMLSNDVICLHSRLTSPGLLNDLWEYDGAVWTWISGSSTMMQIPTYGKLGVVSEESHAWQLNHTALTFDQPEHFCIITTPRTHSLRPTPQI